MHAVMKESSTTTKLHVVFDASAQTTTGYSLNDTLLVGPTLYPDLIDILLRFRSYPVAITADISKCIEQWSCLKLIAIFIGSSGVQISTVSFRTTE